MKTVITRSARLREPWLGARRPSPVLKSRTRPRAALHRLLAVVTLLSLLVGCSTMGGPGGQTPTTSPRSTAAVPSRAPQTAAPTGTPVASHGSARDSRLTAEEARALVVAEHPRYERHPLRPVAQPSGSPGPVAGGGLIGQSRWVIAREVSRGIELTFVTGSGDCPAGCIEHTYDTYLVQPGGTVTFICSEDDAPAGGTPDSTDPLAGLPFEPCAGVPR